MIRMDITERRVFVTEAGDLTKAMMVCLHHIWYVYFWVFVDPLYGNCDCDVCSWRSFIVLIDDTPKATQFHWLLSRTFAALHFYNWACSILWWLCKQKEVLSFNVYKNKTLGWWKSWIILTKYLIRVKALGFLFDYCTQSIYEKEFFWHGHTDI